MKAGAYIVAVKGNIEFPVKDSGRIYKLAQFMHNAVAEEDPTWLQPDDDRVGEREVVLEDLVGQPLNGE
jgi:hypothetical protein